MKYVAPKILETMISSIKQRIIIMRKNGSNCADDIKRLNELEQLKNESRE